MNRQIDFADIQNIPDEKFKLVQTDVRIFDAAPKTRPVGYFEDALRRFVKNKASVAGAIVILIILLFVILAPFITPYKVSDFDQVYAKARPKIKAFERSGFWDGSKKMHYNERYLMYMYAIGMGASDTTGDSKVISFEAGQDNPYRAINKINGETMSGGQNYWNVTVDSYYALGFRYLTITEARFNAIREFEEQSGLQVLYPMVDREGKFGSEAGMKDANYWYRQAPNGAPLSKKGKPMGLEEMQKEGLVPNYLHDDKGELQYFVPRDKTMRDVRVLYYNYYQFMNGKEPVFYFGSDSQGFDIMARMAQGTRLSLLLAVAVSIINLTLGAIIGAVEGYYGGAIDLIIERIIDILSGMPFYVVATLFQLHLVQTGKVSTFVGLLFAFILTGWIGTAYRVRTQFYRFKKEEYILSARTLGASDARLMFKHIFPNAIGTIITSSVLVIPATILSESTLSYLGIVNFQGQAMTSLGTMMQLGQAYLSTDPHILFFPAIIISLLMISFNLFGNGLRDAFNPSLRGADE